MLTTMVMVVMMMTEVDDDDHDNTNDDISITRKICVNTIQYKIHKSCTVFQILQ